MTGQLRDRYNPKWQIAERRIGPENSAQRIGSLVQTNGQIKVFHLPDASQTFDHLYSSDEPQSIPVIYRSSHQLSEIIHAIAHEFVDNQIL